MNKFILTTILLFISHYAFPQTEKWQLAPSLGIDMGGAIAFPLSEIPEGSKGTPQLNPNIGLGFQYRIAPKIKLGLEVNYHILAFTGRATVVSQPFWSDDRTVVTYFSGDAYTDVELRFVEFPLLAYYQIGDHWSLALGAYYSRILEGKFEVEGKNGWLSDDKTITDASPLPGPINVPYNFNEEIDNYDAGAILGFQYQIGHRLQFWGRFHVGFKSIFVPEFNNIEYEMYQLRLSTGLAFVLFQNS